jgi:hypothetical protein
MSNLYFNIDDININETDKIDFKLKVDSKHYKYDYIKEHNQLQIPLDKFEPLLTIFKKYYNKEKITSLEFIEYLNDFNIYLKKYNLFSIKTEDFKTKVSSMDLIESTKENYKIKDNEIGEVNFTIEKSKRINQKFNLNIKKWQVVFNEYNELNKIANKILKDIITKKINSLIEEPNDKRNNNKTVDIIHYSKENTIKTKNNQLSTIQNKRKLKKIFPTKQSLISLTDNLKEIEKYIKNNKNDKIYIKNILQILKMYKISIPTYLKQEKNIKKERER